MAPCAPVFALHLPVFAHTRIAPLTNSPPEAAAEFGFTFRALAIARRGYLGSSSTVIGLPP